jgi:hypothetical protein
MHKLATALVVLAALMSCNKAKEVSSKYQDRAKALAAKYGPKVSDLSKHLPDLASHAKDIPGGDRLSRLLADNKSELESAQELLESLPKRLGSETPEQAEKDLAEADKELSKEVTTAEQDEQQEAQLEGSAQGLKSTDASK